MKKISTYLFLLFSIAYGFSQSPQRMTFQAVIRNNSSTLLSNQPIGIKISILQGSASGTVVFSETQSATTNTNGLVTLQIGGGSVVSGDFSTISWANGPFFIQTETDVTGGTNYSLTATTQLLSVPYALYAETSGSSSPGPQGIQGLTGNTGAQGLAGTNGTNGQDGLSAYQIWLNAGNTGTETQFLTSIQGATGAQGIQGLTGTTGAQGMAGSNGTNGQDGLSAYQIWLNAGNTGTETQFLTSIQGATGAQGIQGLTGTTGAQGMAGSNGTNGQDGLSAYQIWLNAGNTGTESQFLTSIQGATGTQGIQGLIGNTGAQGLQGPAGANGIQGPMGLTGATGAQGIQGIKGDTGLTGAQGLQGPAGANGIQGPVGLTGATGAQGLQGNAGTNGTNGIQGPIGLTGATGAQGLQGLQGNAGTNGTNGAQGPIGLTGATGTQGVQGIQGITGPSGATGATGATGPQGIQGLTGILPNGTSTGNTTYWNGTEWVTNSNNLYNNGSNIGIGTTIPSEKLHVTGNVMLSGTIKAQDSGQNITLIPGSTGNVDVSSKQIKNLANPTATKDAVTAEVVQNSTLIYGAATGAANAYEVALTPAPTAYQAGMLLTFKSNVANTGSATLNINGLGTKTIKKLVSTDVAANDITLGQMVIVIYDGTNFQILNPSVSNALSTSVSNDKTLIYLNQGF